MNSITLVVLMACLLGVGLATFYKLRKVHLMLYAMQTQAQQDMNAHYRQQELLHGLYVDLGLTKSLPGTRDWAASPDFLTELMRHALSAKPRTVVECSSGTSTLVLALHADEWWRQGLQPRARSGVLPSRRATTWPAMGWRSLPK